MAFALVGSAGAASQGAANTAVTPAWGAGESRTAGNLLLLWVSGTGAATVPGTPSGWTQAVARGGTSCSATIFYKIAAGSDAAPTVGAVASVVWAAHLEEWSGGSGAQDRSSSNAGTTSPLTATNVANNGDVNELVAMCGADFRSVARASNDTWTSNHGTPTLRASNNGTSSVNHYSHATLISNDASTGDTGTMTLSITTSITGLAVAICSFSLAAAASHESAGVRRGSVRSQAANRASNYRPRHDGILIPDRRIWVPA